MSFYLKRAFFYNRAPLSNLNLEFDENQISILISCNGKGKTTIISHIVDAIYEFARPVFINEFSEKSNKLYRFSSQIFSLSLNQPSIVYLRFILDNESVDYLDIRGRCSEEFYNKIVDFEDKIPFSDFSVRLGEEGYIKTRSANFSKEKVLEVFGSNILTYFPSYRFEQPGYLNDPYKIKVEFSKEPRFSGFLVNPVEVISSLPKLANWIMDLILDNQYLNVNLEDISNAVKILPNGNFNVSAEDLPGLINYIISICINEKSNIQNNLNLILTETLSSKGFGRIRFGIGPRNFYGSRVQVVTIDSKPIYPSIFNISSGEASLLCLFGELIRQFDNLDKKCQLSDIKGIVLIDEVEKHLHIKLQKEILPRLLSLFPNLQFILTSHSPFLAMGLSGVLEKKSKIFDLDRFGISSDPTENEIFKEVYSIFVDQNLNFQEKYNNLLDGIKKGAKPLIITEGKTDIWILKKAFEVLEIKDLEIDFFEDNEDFGESLLKQILESLARIPNNRKIIGIFDRDVQNTVNEIERNGKFKKFSGEVFGFCIPIPSHRANYKNISIEFYFKDEEVKTELEGKRLFFSNEIKIESSATNRNEKKYVIRDEPVQSEELDKKIIDKDIGGFERAFSKSRFADSILNNQEFASNFSFEEFNLIFNRIREILS